MAVKVLVVDETGRRRLMSRLPVYLATYEIKEAVESNTPITLPEGQKYEGQELQVFLNDEPLTPYEHFEYLGHAPRTQIACIFNLVKGDKLKFFIDRIL